MIWTLAVVYMCEVFAWLFSSLIFPQIAVVRSRSIVSENLRANKLLFLRQQFFILFSEYKRSSFRKSKELILSFLRITSSMVLEKMIIFRFCSHTWVVICKERSSKLETQEDLFSELTKDVFPKILASYRTAIFRHAHCVRNVLWDKGSRTDAMRVGLASIGKSNCTLLRSIWRQQFIATDSTPSQSIFPMT